MPKLKTALVVGATGLVGGHVVQQLCENPRYVSVTALARRELAYEHPKLTVQLTDFDTLSEADVQFVDDVFCCLGTTRKKAGSREQFEKVDVEYPLRVAALTKHVGARHFIVISAMGANEKSAAYYNRVKGKLEQELIELEFPKLSIVRPSLLVGQRAEFRLGEKSGELVLKIGNPLLIGPMKRFRSIEASQVATAMIAIALQPQSANVSIYSSDELAQMQLPELEEEVESPFNWRKLKGEDIEPLDEEVVFKRKPSSLRNADQQEHVIDDENFAFKKRREQQSVLDEEVSFDSSRYKKQE